MPLVSFAIITSIILANHSYFARYPSKTISDADRIDRTVALEQQECQGSPASSRLDNTPCRSYQAMRGRSVTQQAGCGFVRTVGRRVSRYSRKVRSQSTEIYAYLINELHTSIIAAEGAIANVVGMTQMQPPVKDLRTFFPPLLVSSRKLMRFIQFHG